MWPKIGNASISTGEVILTSISQGFDQENLFFFFFFFFEGCYWFKLNNLGLALYMALKFYTSVAKRKVKTKSQKFLGLIARAKG